MGVEVAGEVTDIGALGSRILDGEEGTDIGVGAAADWLNRAASWDLVTPTLPTQSSRNAPACARKKAPPRSRAFDRVACTVRRGGKSTSGRAEHGAINYSNPLGTRSLFALSRRSGLLIARDACVGEDGLEFLEGGEDADGSGFGEGGAVERGAGEGVGGFAGDGLRVRFAGRSGHAGYEPATEEKGQTRPETRRPR